MSLDVPPSGTRGRELPAGRLYRFGVGLNTAAYRLLRGRGMGSMLLLTTIGARTGLERTNPVAAFPDGEGAWLIVASRGGSAHHPAWYHNLAANPDRVWVETGGRQVRVRPRALLGAERVEPWARITARSSQFAGYQASTDREIPVVRLTAIPE